MSTVKLKEQEGTKILGFLKEVPNTYVGNEEACRRFVEAVLWQSRTGAHWRLLPEKYGKWNTIYKRFARWCDQGVWERMFEHSVDDPDLEYGMIASTIIRAHPCAAGAEK